MSRSRDELARTARRALMVVAALGSSVLAAFGAPACATSDENAVEQPDQRTSVRVVDGSDEATTDAGAEGSMPDVPCAVGNLCRAPVPFTHASVTAIAGRAKNDVWAAGSFGLVMHYDGQAWTALESDLGEALTTLVLTEDETWGGAGTLVLRRNLDGASVQKVRVPVQYGIPTALAIVPDGGVHLGRATQSSVLHFDVESGDVTSLPDPIFPGSGVQVVKSRAAFWSGTALWFVGDEAAIVRYPLAAADEDAGAGDGGDDDGGSRSVLGRGAVIPVASHTDLRAVWGQGEHVFAAVRDGVVLEVDGAVTREHDTGSSATLNAIFGLSPTDVWAAGEDGTVLHFDGTSWARIDLGSYTGHLHSIWGSDPDDVWIGGENRLFHWGPLP